MSKNLNKSVVLKNRPIGLPSESDFEIKTNTVREAAEGEVVVKGLYLSLDPYMRGRMSAAKSYAPPIQIGDIMVGEVVGKVIESKHVDFPLGEYVAGMMGWQEIATLPGENLRKITPDIEPISYALGILGMPGLTAYFSLLEIGKPKSGETVVVSAASGAVGSVVGQLAKSYGCRVIGIVGNELKSEYITKKLGFDGAINYRLYENIKAPLRELCPDGVDIYFDNVGGGITDAVMNSLAFRARIIVCGMISEYNLEKAYIGPSHLRSILVSRARVEGFLVFDWADRYSEGITNLKKMLDDDMLTYSEDIVEGIENAPSGFLELFSGKNLGKRLVRLSQ